MQPETPTPPTASPENFDTPKTCDAGASSVSDEDAQSGIGKQFTDEFLTGCAKQSERQQILEDIIARIASGERAVIAFCKDTDIPEIGAFNLGVVCGKLCVAEYD